MEGNTLTIEQKQNMVIISYMTGEVGRYISFSTLSQYPLEQQYQIVIQIANYIENTRKERQR